MKLGNIFLRVSIKEQILFARNISLMSRSGIPLLDSLHMIQQQTQSSGFKRILATVISDVENGQFLSTSLKKYESVFGNLFINVIQIGEASGTLAENLGFLADELKKRQLLRGKITGALLYPIIIVITTIALTSVLTFFVFPKILPIFDSFKLKLPITTRILIILNKFFLAYWFWIIIGIIVAIVTFYLLMQLKPFRYQFHRFMLRMPIIGPMIKSIQMAVFARTLALLLKSGVKIVEALTISTEITSNLVYKRILHDASEQIRIGAPLGKYLSAYPRVFPSMFAQMIEVSETAGTLDTTLQYLSEYYEAELDDTTRTMISLLEPLMMLTMGGMVGFIAISIILPIYSISQVVGR